MHVGLVPGVPEDSILRAVEDAVQRQGELDDAQVGAEMSTGFGDSSNKELADLLGEAAQIGIAQGAKIGWRSDPIEDGCR